MTYVQDDSATDFWFDNSTVERAQRRCFAWPRSTSEPSPLTTRLVTRPSISASCMTTPTSRALLKSHSRNYAPVRSSSSKRPHADRPSRTAHAIRNSAAIQSRQTCVSSAACRASITRIRKPIRAGSRSIVRSSRLDSGICQRRRRGALGTRCARLSVNYWPINVTVAALLGGPNETRVSG